MKVDYGTDMIESGVQNKINRAKKYDILDKVTEAAIFNLNVNLIERKYPFNLNSFQQLFGGYICVNN